MPFGGWGGSNESGYPIPWCQKGSTKASWGASRILRLVALRLAEVVREHRLVSARLREASPKTWLAPARLREASPKTWLAPARLFEAGPKTWLAPARLFEASRVARIASARHVEGTCPSSGHVRKVVFSGSSPVGRLRADRFVWRRNMRGSNVGRFVRLPSAVALSPRVYNSTEAPDSGPPVNPRSTLRATP